MTYSRDEGAAGHAPVPLRHGAGVEIRAGFERGVEKQVDECLKRGFSPVYS